MQKVFQLGATYEVPVAYASEQFAIPGGTIADGACTTVVNSAGGNDQRLAENGGILNQFKCCNGQIFGHISTDGAGSTEVDLCTHDVGDMASQCSVFGANMYNTATSDPSIGCTNNTHFSALTEGCVENVCHCKAHGVAVANAQCTSHGLEQCATCDTGYHTEYTTAQGDAFDVFHKDYATIPCIRNSCRCANGAPFVGASAATEGCADDGTTNKCSTCLSGNTLNATTLQCDPTMCTCVADYPTTLFPSGGEVIGIPAQGINCTTPGTQKCTLCNTGFDFDDANNQCTQSLSHCADSKNTCNQVQDRGNTCNTTTGTDPKFTCSCTGNYGLDSNCHKCDHMRDSDSSNCGPYKCGTAEQLARCATKNLNCTPSRSWAYTANLQPKDGQHDTNNGEYGTTGCAFDCKWNFFYTGRPADVCTLNKPCEAATWVAPLNGGLGDCGGDLSIAHPANPSSPQDASVTLDRDYFGIPSDTVCVPTCDLGYFLNRAVNSANAKNAMCWNGALEMPTCDPIPCGSIVAPLNGTMGTCESVLESGASCQPACDAGYTSSGAYSCLLDVLTVSTCMPDPCEAPAAPDNGAVGTCTLPLTSGGACQPTCDAGYFVSGTASCDAGTTTPATCSACAAADFKVGGTAATSCEAKTTTCPAGEYFTASADSTADSACTGCPALTFTSATGSATECTPWSTCVAGEGKSADGSTTADTECETCTNADFKFSQIDDRSACQDHTQCDTGEGSTWESLSDATKAESTCAGCSSTEFSDASDYGPCQTRTASCPAGQYFTAGSVSADATCVACDVADFKVGDNAVTSCAAKATTCPAGEYFTASADSTADATCVACDAADFKVGDNAVTSCVAKRTTCLSGVLTASADSTADATCD
jgi:hypothetical protein